MSSDKADRLKAQKYVALNRRARHDYAIIDNYEAGIILTGTEVKSLRRGEVSIQESFAVMKDGELQLMNAYIAEYKQAGQHLQHESHRPRILLLHKRERNKLLGAVKKEGLTIVPLSIYFNKRGIAKVDLGLAKGKQQADKRAAIKDRDWSRDQARIMRNKNG
ncbi:MAG: SsrA-binding protein SmpB [Proteobacteria bacterium]|jgi:SsrA-binding protein|nr:SsrA-binding protein SmpB [Alphaproteobacteria bacterium]NCC02460.1 SsrA-binding protein SmpB [Pseudomonadota bacterium]